MKTIREEIITIKDSKGVTVNLGDAVIMSVEGRVLVGKYAGIGGRGSWIFKGIREYEGVTYKIMPRCIVSMYKFDGGITDGVQCERTELA